MLKITTRYIAYLITSLFYSLTASSVIASTLSESLKGDSGVDLIFNLIGALCGGIIRIAMVFSNQEQKIVMSLKTVVSTLVVSVLGGGVVFIITESDTVFKITDSMLQLGVVCLFGATSTESWSLIKKKFLNKIESDSQEIK